MKNDIQLPSAIALSDEYCSLSDEEQQSLVARLGNARELGSSLSSGIRLKSSLDFGDFVENLELDLAVIQELTSARSGGLSRWLLHYSWVFNTSPQKMHRSLEAPIVHALERDEPFQNASQHGLEEWFQQAGLDLVEIVNGITKAKSFDEALGSHIVLDIQLSRMLLTCYKLRLSKLMRR